MKRIAAIDIGTNTVLLLVAEISSQGEIRPLIQKETIVRLGEEVDKTGTLKQEAISRTLSALKDCTNLAREAGAKIILASATSAVRDATNRPEFTAQVKQALNIDIQVLTGDEEARLTYLGALSNKSYLDGRIFLIDIGGGSTEFIWGNSKTIEYATSLDIGSARLTERYVKHDPIDVYEFDMIKKTINESLKQTCNQRYLKTDYVIGVGGTITTLAAIHLELETYDCGLVDGSILTLREVEKFVHNIKKLTISERKLICVLKPERAFNILTGAIILLLTMKKFRLNEIIVSDRGLRFGLISTFLRIT